jgi:hypothetical protein
MGLSAVILIGSAMAPQMADAQVSAYHFSRQFGTFTPLVGATTLVSGSGWNDGVYTITPSAPFWFDGTSHAQLHVSCNGFIAVGTAPNSSNIQPLSSSATYAGAISPFGANLISSGVASSAVLWKEEGREVVVEWRDVRRRLSGNNESFSVQARLNTSDMTIQFVYTSVNLLSPSELQQPQVGLRGPDNSFPLNVFNREVGLTGNYWGNSIGGTTNTDVCRFTAKTPARKPFDGLTYRYVPPGVMLDITTDSQAAQTSWVIVPLAGGPPVCSGSGYANSSSSTLFCPITAGNYKLVVLDAAGDGMCCTHGNGGYLLRTSNDLRIIDNTADGTFTDSSHVAQGFSLPVGDDRIVPWRSDWETAIPSDFIQATPRADVSAEYDGPDKGDDGYQFWFFNPDGGYSRRLFQSHATNNYMFPTGPERCTYLRLDNVLQNPLPINTMLNVKVRSCLDGEYRPWGQACRLKLDLPNQCPVVQLIDNPADPHHSCGLTNVALNGSTTLWATFISTADKYRFQFTRPGYTRNIVSNGSTLNLIRWGTNPLQYGMLEYGVKVAVSFDQGATFCPYGPVCTLTTAAAAPSSGGRAMEQVDQALAQNLDLWPSPNTGERLNVTLSGFGTATTSVMITLSDVQGRTIHQENIVVEGDQLRTTLETSSLSKGIYMVNVTAQGRSWTERFVRE